MCAAANSRGLPNARLGNNLQVALRPPLRRVQLYRKCRARQEEGKLPPKIRPPGVLDPFYTPVTPLSARAKGETGPSIALLVQPEHWMIGFLSNDVWSTRGDRPR